MQFLGRQSKTRSFWWNSRDLRCRKKPRLKFRRTRASTILCKSKTSSAWKRSKEISTSNFRQVSKLGCFPKHSTHRWKKWMIHLKIKTNHLCSQMHQKAHTKTRGIQVEWLREQVNRCSRTASIFQILTPNSASELEKSKMQALLILMKSF